MIPFFPYGFTHRGHCPVLGLGSRWVRKGDPFYAVVGLYGTPPGCPRQDFGRLDGKRSEYAIRLSGQILPCQNIFTLTVRSNDTQETFMVSVAEFRVPPEIPAGSHKLELYSVLPERSPDPFAKIGEAVLTLAEPAREHVLERHPVAAPQGAKASPDRADASLEIAPFPVEHPVSDAGLGIRGDVSGESHSPQEGR